MKRLSSLVLNRPWLFIVAAVVVTAAMAAGIPNLKFDASIEAMIPDDDPVLSELADVTDEFGSQELFLVAIRAEDIFRASTLKKIADLEEQIAALDGVSSVQSPFNAQLVESDFFGLDIRPIVDSIPQTAAEITDFREAILASSYADRLVTSDGRGAMLMIDFEPADNDAQREVVQQVEQIIERYQNPEEVYLVGDLYAFYYTELAMEEDLRMLVPFVVVVIIAILYLTFRSALGVFIPMLTVLFSLIWTLGLMSFLGIPVSMISMVLPVILITLGVASSIHILNKYQEAIATGADKRTALETTYQTITPPVVMAALTTAAGFASLVTAFVEPIREFGLLTAFGVFAAMTLSLTAVPAILMLVQPPRPRTVSEGKMGWLDRLLAGVTKISLTKPKLVGFGALLLLVVAGLSAFSLTLESNIINYFADQTPIKRGTSIVEELFGGSMQLSVVFDTGEPDGIKDPDVLREMAEAQEFLNSFDTINHAVSIADLLCELNQALWDGDPDFYQIPDTREAVAQQLLLFTMQGGSGLDSLVSYDYQSALITAQMKTLDAEAMDAVISELEQYVQERFADNKELDVRVVGTPKVMMRLMDRYVQTQISSLATSVVAVGIIVIILMRSVLLGLFCLVPLVFTVVINFGIMGTFGIPLDAITSIIASLAIGIGIDYSIHYITRYRLEVASRGELEAAIIETGKTAGRGIFYNALALIAGFLVLVFSRSFRAISIFGYLVAATMLISSAATLLIIPPLLKGYEKLKSERSSSMKTTKLAVFLGLMLMVTVGVVSADSLSGQDVLDKMGTSSILTESGSAEVEMITENAKGVQRSYGLRLFLQQDDDGDKQLLEYLAPADVKGTKFLSITEPGSDAQMWLYMPALGRERRIAAHMTGDKFMGTDFTYKEISGGFDYDDQYAAARLPDEVVAGVICYVLDLAPEVEDVLYERVKMWVRQDEVMPLRIELYDPANTLTKTLSLGDYREVEGELVPHHLIMADELTGTRTILQITEMTREGVSDDLFTLRYLRR